jgi:hypothetical protein
MNTNTTMPPRTAQIRRRLIPLDWTILRILGTVDYASTRQLEQLSLPQTPSPARARRVRRRVNHLHALGVVYRLKRSVGGLGGGSRGSVWTLDQHGHNLLRHLLYQASDPATNAGRRRRVRPSWERGTTFLLHSLAVTQCLVDVSGYAHGRDGVEVVSWLGEPESYIDYAHSGQPARLTPDALCEVQVGAEVIVSAVEVDRGTEGMRVLLEKASRYIAYAHRHPDCPQVVWAFTSAERAHQFANAIHRAYAQPATRSLFRRGLFAITTTPHAAAALCGAGDASR